MGGLFFDDLNCWDFETCFKYIQAVGNGYLNAILPIFEKHREQPYTEAQTRISALSPWQICRI